MSQELTVDYCGNFLAPLNNLCFRIELPFRLLGLIGSFVLFRTKPCCNKSKYSDVEFLSSEDTQISKS